MVGMTERIANLVCCCMPLTERDLSLRRLMCISEFLSRQRCWRDGHAADDSFQPALIFGISVDRLSMQAVMHDISALLAMALWQPSPQTI